MLNCQEKAENIYMVSRYMHSRLGLGEYSPYICIYSVLGACTQSIANVYIEIHLNLGAQD